MEEMEKRYQGKSDVTMMAECYPQKNDLKQHVFTILQSFILDI